MTKKVEPVEDKQPIAMIANCRCGGKVHIGAGIERDGVVILPFSVYCGGCALVIRRYTAELAVAAWNTALLGISKP